VRKGLPPIISIHGTADTIVPYDHAVRLHKQLNKRKVTNRLISIAGGGHGGFPLDEHVAAMDEVRNFLRANGVLN
jgi:dipeptidyl aminopeptidase/acylaminoacyl peptidase